MLKRLLPIFALSLAIAFPVLADEPAKVGHMVYFELKDKSPEAKAKLVAACDKYLKGMEGVEYYSAGVRGEEFDREVNAKDWDVALNVVFKDKESYKKYEPHADHLKFIAEGKDNWKGVKVYDSLIGGGKK